MRALLRHFVEHLTVGLGVARRRRARRPRLAILAYHNVVSEAHVGRGDASLHIGLDRFRSHLDRIQELAVVRPLDEAVRDPEGSRPSVVLTFDDAYRGTLENALPELVTRGLPATVFVCPGLLDAEGFWWDRVAAASDDELAHDVRETALTECGGRADEIAPRWSSANDLPPSFAPAPEAVLDEVAEAPGITYGSHTWSHPNLATLDGDELHEELERPRRWLTERFGVRGLDEHLSLPYGLGGERIATAAHGAGYRFVYRIEGGLFPLSPAPSLVPRINVPAGLSPNGLELRLSGFLNS